MQWVRRHIKYGADWIKLHATGSVPGRSGELLVWNREEIKAACQTAHELSVPVMAHCRGAQSVKVCAEEGVDLILHASRTKLPINIKKGQFMSASSMKFVVEKIESVGNKRILLTERGTSFGHNDLIVDFRQIHLMKQLNYPIIIDVTHSLQLPNQKSGITGGRPEFIDVISKAGIASGVNGVFLETHFKPEEALSDGHNMLKLSSLDHLLKKLSDLYRAL